MRENAIYVILYYFTYSNSLDVWYRQECRYCKDQLEFLIKTEKIILFLVFGMIKIPPNILQKINVNSDSELSGESSVIEVTLKQHEY